MLIIMVNCATRSGAQETVFWFMGWFEYKAAGDGCHRLESGATVKVNSPYDSQFYAMQSDLVSGSARACVPLIMDLLAPRSVVDVGCGQGDWLHAFQICGVEDILGVDGDYVRREDLRIQPLAFRAWDLTRPLDLGRRFDLAVCLEVAEHLPELCAGPFVRQLVALAPAVVFSAAVPGQGGMNHINEQWFWYWQGLFAGNGYRCVDPFRKTLWQRPDTALYYQQNMFLFVDPRIHADLLEKLPEAQDQRLTLVLTSILKTLTKPRKSLWKRLVSRFLGCRV
jgi:SAM-dependent methyltransferase